MLMLTQLCGFMAGGKPPPSIEFLQSTGDSANLTTYSFAAQNIGAADVTRRILAVASYTAIAARTFTSFSIGGVNAPIVEQANAALRGVAIASLLVPAGATATIAFTMSGACSDGHLALFRALNETGAAATDTMTDVTVSSSALSGAIDVAAAGWILAGATFSASGTASWTGVSEAYDFVTAGTNPTNTGGIFAAAGAEANRAVSVTGTGSPTTGALVGVSWG